MKITNKSHPIAVSNVHRIPLEDNSVDLVVCSPPYEAARDYGIRFELCGQDWVDWAVVGFKECLRVCRGLVAWVVEGTGQQTVNWSGTPVLLMADLIRLGIPIWKPSIYGRYSLPGRFSVLRNNWEFVVCSTGGKAIPWSDPTAMGSNPKCQPGGRTRPRKRDGSRNVAGTGYNQPKRTNAGNIVWCGAVGGGNMGGGSDFASQNEAPFPEYLSEFFIRSFCPIDGVVLDPFSGSGTTASVAEKHGRRFVAMDIRLNQCHITKSRVISNGKYQG